MKVITAHKFFYPGGGADNVFLDTARLLESRGHKVVYFAMKDKRNMSSEYERYFVSGVDYESRDLFSIMKASFRILYSVEARIRIGKLLRLERPDIAHLHNIYHHISPSIIHSIKKAGVPVVMTMHDYKLVCASYLLRAGDKICEDCKGGRYYRCFLNRCVKASAAKSLLSTAEMYLHHRIMDIYSLVDAFISPSAFMKRKIEDMGFKGNIVRLPNFIDFTEFRPKYEWTGRTIAYCGRLSAEKGVGTLISAVKGLKDLRLKIIGDGPLRAQLQARAESEAIDNVEFLGYRSRQEVKEDMGSSMFVIMPSECYENNPKAVMEAFALGKPVLGSRLGGIPELVRDGETGFTFEPFDAADMRAKIISLAERPDEIIRMGRNARSFVESEFNAGRYYESLMRIYSDVISGSKRR